MAFIHNSLIDTIVSKGAEFVPVLGPAAKYSQKAMQIG